MINLKKQKPVAVLAILLFAAGLVAFILLSACASSAPRWTAEEARALEPAPTAPEAMAFPIEQPTHEPEDAQFSDDFVPERDVATAELAERIALAARALDALDALDVRARAEAGTVNAADASPFTAARQQLEDARLAEENLRGASLARWKNKRALAEAAVGALEQHVAALVASRE